MSPSLRENKPIDTVFRGPYILAQAFVTSQSHRKVLLINKRNRAIAVSVAEFQGSEVAYVDQSTRFQPPATAHLSESRPTLSGFEVAVVNRSK